MSRENCIPPVNALLGFHLGISIALLVGFLSSAEARQPDPIPPLAPVVSDTIALARVPSHVKTQRGLHLVLDRSIRQLMVLKDGVLLHRYLVAVGTDGWETPAGRHRVFQRIVNPGWEHISNGKLIAPGPTNPLGSRWIGFYQDCMPRRNVWDGERYLTTEGCAVIGFHGTPHRWTVGRAVTHGCVRLYDEDVRELFELVERGTLVTILP